MAAFSESLYDGYFCPSPRKVPNADFRPELLTKQAFWRIPARCFERSDRRNVNSDRAAAHRETINAY
jgi:hypothetical protein